MQVRRRISRGSRADRSFGLYRSAVSRDPKWVVAFGISNPKCLPTSKGLLSFDKRNAKSISGTRCCKTAADHPLSSRTPPRRARWLQARALLSLAPSVPEPGSARRTKSGITEALSVSSTPFAQRCSETNNPDDVFFSDFESYEPSLGAPAIFVCSPIFDDPKRVGLLVMQLSNTEFDRVVSGNRGWERDGPGPIRRLRDCRVRLLDAYDRPNLCREPREASRGYASPWRAEDKLERMKTFGTTVLQLEVRRPSVELALQGKEGPLSNWAARDEATLSPTRLCAWKVSPWTPASPPAESHWKHTGNTGGYRKGEDEDSKGSLSAPIRRGRCSTEQNQVLMRSQRPHSVVFTLNQQRVSRFQAYSPQLVDQAFTLPVNGQDIQSVLADQLGTWRNEHFSHLDLVCIQSAGLVGPDLHVCGFFKMKNVLQVAFQQQKIISTNLLTRMRGEDASSSRITPTRFTSNRNCSSES